jgi:hypothetical protein
MSPSIRAFAAPTALDAGTSTPSRLPSAADGLRPFAEFNLGDASSTPPGHEQPGLKPNREENRETKPAADADNTTVEDADERRPVRRPKADEETDAAATDLLAWPCAAPAVSVPITDEKSAHDGDTSDDQTESGALVVTDRGASDTLQVPVPNPDVSIAAESVADTRTTPTESASADAALLAGQDAPFADPIPTVTAANAPTENPFQTTTRLTSEADFTALTGRWSPISELEPVGQTESENDSVTPAPARGTSAADEVVEVKSWFQQDEFAGSPADRPRSAVGLSRGGSRDFSSEREARRSDSSLVAPLLADPFRTASEPAAAEVELPAPLDVPATLTPLIQEQAVRLRHASLQSLEVVLRPDGQTELHLQLTQHAGQIEATVRCDRGDAEKFGGGWAKLQESLASQGIRLAPLTESSMSSAGDHSHRQPATPQPPPEAPAPRWPTASAKSGLAPSRVPSSTTPVLPALAATRRTLESWA